MQYKSVNLQLAAPHLLQSCLSTGIIHNLKTSAQSLKHSMERSGTQSLGAAPQRLRIENGPRIGETPPLLK